MAKKLAKRLQRFIDDLTVVVVEPVKKKRKKK